MARYVKSGTVNTVQEINSELEKIATSQAEFLARDGETPNEMKADLDMNSNRILNVPEPTSSSEPLRLADLERLLTAEEDILGISFTIRTFATDIQLGDFDTINSVVVNYDSTTGDTGGRTYVKTGVTNIGRAGTRVPERDLIYDLSGREFKPTVPWVFPLLWMGQSNAAGATQSGAGSQVIEDGVFIFSKGPTPARGWTVPAFGSNPLPSTGSNNAGIHFANEIVRRTGRPVYMVLNALGGQSIAEWVGSGTSSSMWVDLTNSLTDAGFADDSLEAVGWMQGEADGDDQSTAYNTYGTYKAGMGVLFAQLQALSEWGQNTQFIASGVGEWNDQPNPERNDVNQTLNNDDAFPFARNVYTAGLTRNPVVGEQSHFDGGSLVQLGLNMAELYLTGKVANKLISPTNQDAPNIYGVYGPTSTVTLERAFLKGDTTVIANDATITWPPKPKVWDGATTTIDVTDTSSGRTRLVGSFSYKGFDYTGPMDLNRIGQWRFLSSQGKLKLLQKPTGGANTALSFQNGTFTPLRWELDNETFSAVNATIELPEPTASDGGFDLTGVRCSFLTFSITGGSTFLTISGGATGKFIDKTGAVVDQIEINVARGFVTLVMVNGSWLVESQNF